jgi:hypothetical protein
MGPIAKRLTGTFTASAPKVRFSGLDFNGVRGILGDDGFGHVNILFDFTSSYLDEFSHHKR